MTKKQCSDCGQLLPLTEFYVKDGYVRSRCKPCHRAQVRAATAARRAEMGDEAWLAYNRKMVYASRARRGYETEREYARAKRLAIAVLIDRHRREFDRLLTQARQGILDHP